MRPATVEVLAADYQRLRSVAAESAVILDSIAHLIRLDAETISPLIRCHADGIEQQSQKLKAVLTGRGVVCDSL